MVDNNELAQSLKQLQQSEYKRMQNKIDRLTSELVRVKGREKFIQSGGSGENWDSFVGDMAIEHLKLSDDGRSISGWDELTKTPGFEKHLSHSAGENQQQSQLQDQPLQYSSRRWEEVARLRQSGDLQPAKRRATTSF